MQSETNPQLSSHALGSLVDDFSTSDQNRMLVVTDNDAERDELCSLLRAEGYRASGSRDAFHAMALLRQHEYGILLCDRFVGEIDGALFVREAQAIRPEVVPIFLTTQQARDNRGEGAARTESIVRPFRIGEIRPVVVRCIEARRLRMESARERAASEAPHARLPAQPANLPRRILVVDDDPIVLMALRNMLEVDGHLVMTAAGGRIGIASFLECLHGAHPFDMVITDFGMPDVDGREVARSVKAASASTLVIMLTGGGPRVDARDDWQEFVDNIIGKPPRLADLRAVVNQAADTGKPP